MPVQRIDDVVVLRSRLAWQQRLQRTLIAQGCRRRRSCPARPRPPAVERLPFVGPDYH
jgi:hypothetical protein